MRSQAIALLMFSVALTSGGQTKTSQTFVVNNWTPTTTSNVFTIYDGGPKPYNEHAWALEIIDGYFKRNPGQQEYLFVYRSIPTGAYVKIDRAGNVKRHLVSKQDMMLMLVAGLLEDSHR